MGTDRLAKAKEIIARGEVSLNPDGSMLIRGHHVTETNCDCLDFVIRGTAECKHRIAFGMSDRSRLTPLQETITLGEFLKLDTATDFVNNYGEELLNKLKARQEVMETRNKLLWL